MARKKKPASKKRRKSSGKKKGQKKSTRKSTKGPRKKTQQPGPADQPTESGPPGSTTASPPEAAAATEGSQARAAESPSPAGEPDAPEAGKGASAEAEAHDEAAAAPEATPEVSDSQTPDAGGDVAEDHRAAAENEVLDLDADVVDGGSTDVAQLIAETVAMAPEEGAEPEPTEPVIDLDADVVQVVDETASSEAADEESATRSAAADDDGSAEDTAGVGAPPAPGPAEAAGALAPTTADGEAPDAREAVDLGPVSSPEIRDRLLAEALAHAEHQDARYRVPFVGSSAASRWKLLAAAVLFLVAGITAIAPPGWARPEPPAQLGSAERARNLRLALLLQAQQIEAFRVRTQRLPATLEEVAATLPGVRYVRSGGRAYQLIAYQADGNAIVYDSGSPTAAFDELGGVWPASPGAVR